MAKQADPAVAGETEGTALATTNSNDDFADFAGRGAEGVQARDKLVPRLAVLQGLSEQIKPRHSSYIEGAKEGDIADLGTGEIFAAPLWVLPCHYSKVWIEWAPRNSGKGIVAMHATESAAGPTTRNDRGQNVLANGNYLVETAQIFVLNLAAGGRPSFISMTSTQLKKARRWMTLATGERLRRADGSEFQPPLFYRTYLLGTAAESNNQGGWVGWTVQPGKALPEVTEYDWRALKARAVEFQASIARGELRADEGQDAGGGGAAADASEEAPF